MKFEKTHGGTGTRLYKAWTNMRQRCAYPKDVNYHRYGGRGITVCAEWSDDFASFRDWAMANGYTDNLTLDRIDNDGNYSPDNCRWATPSEQQSNLRNNLYITVGSETKTAREWSRITGIKYSTIITRLRFGWEPEAIVGTPT